MATTRLCARQTSSSKALRRCGLLANGGKLAVELAGRYAKEIEGRDTASERLREVLAGARWRAGERTDDGVEGQESPPESLVEGAEDDDGYGQSGAPPEDTWDLISARLEIDDETLAEAGIAGAMAGRPGGDGTHRLSNAHFHERVVAALSVLTPARNPHALPHAETLLTYYPDKSMIVCEYLASLARTRPTEVQDVCLAVLVNGLWSLSWQRAWLWSTVARVPVDQVSADVMELAATTVLSDAGTWIERVEAARVLGLAGTLGRSVVVNLWERAPVVFRGELIEAVVATLAADPTADWAERFLASVRQDPLLAVVRHVPRGRDRPAGGDAAGDTETTGPS